MIFSEDIQVQTINHLGLIAGVIDEIGIEEIINDALGIDEREIVTAGQIVKAIILNGLGFISRPLYLFPQFFKDKATEHLIGKGILPEHLNDDRIGRIMDKLYEKGLSPLFLIIAIDFETMIVGDSALYTENNLKLMSGIEWLSRVPLSIKEAKNLVSELSESDLTPSSLEGYSWCEVRNNYAEIEQRWLIVESEKRKASDLEKLSKKIEKEKEKSLETLKKLMREEFRSSEGAYETVLRLNKTLKYHHITELKMTESELNNHKKKSKKKEEKSGKTYQVTAIWKSDLTKINESKKRAGRFVFWF